MLSDLFAALLESQCTRDVVMNKAVRGITLIELIAVLAVLGVLAAFAFPRFISLQTQARVALVTSLGGSVHSAATQAHLQWVLQGEPATITMEGETITILNGYPNEATIDDTLMDYTGFKYQVTKTARFRRQDAPQPNTCMVTYEDAVAGKRPSVIAYTSGC